MPTIEIPCILIIDRVFFVDKKLSLTTNRSEALIIYGRRRAKRMALILQKNGLNHVEIAFANNV